MANLQEVRVPDIGGFDDVEIIEMLVKVGDSVQQEDSLITLESDKASMEIPAPASGTIKELKVKLGDRLAEGDVILLLEVTAAQASKTESPAKPAASSPEKIPTPIAVPQKVANDEKAAASAPRPSPTEHIDDVEFVNAHASPAVRRFARELGANLSKMKGSGAKGRILEEDVKTFIKQALSGGARTAAATSGSGIPAMPSIDFNKWGETESKELSRIQKLSGTNLHRNWLNVPHVTHHDEADITELESFRKSLSKEAEKRELRITALAFIMKAVVAALKEFPQVNSSLSADNQSIIYKKYFHIGVAVDTPNGLVVPVFRDVDQKSIYDLAAEMADISNRARIGKLMPAEMQGGCFSISSLGGIGGTAFTPIVNAPEVAILGVTRARMQPVWNGKDFTPRLMLPLDLSYDHRVIDGALAARFTAYLVQLLGDTRRMLL